MTGQRILLVARDRLRIHALEEIVRLIVFADMVETEGPVLFLVPRPLGARCGPLFLHSGHSHIAASSRACACCFALSLLGLMRMESKNLDESIGMAGYYNAKQ